MAVITRRRGRNIIFVCTFLSTCFCELFSGDGSLLLRAPVQHTGPHCRCLRRGDDRAPTERDRERSSERYTQIPGLRYGETNTIRKWLMTVLSLYLDSTPASRRLSSDRLESLRTLAYSDNTELQRSAALCFSELSDTCQ